MADDTSRPYFEQGRLGGALWKTANEIVTPRKISKHLVYRNATGEKGSKKGELGPA